MNDGLARDVVLLGSADQPAPDGLAAMCIPADDRDAWADCAASGLANSVHVVAVGADAPGVLSLAARHGERVVSLVLVDPEVALDDPAHVATMDAVTVPTLVIASAPTPDHPVDQAQSVAGGVDNGVFVIIDGSEAPTLVTRPGSVHEWAGAFMAIAEGLAETRTDLITSSDES